MKQKNPLFRVGKAREKHELPGGLPLRRTITGTASVERDAH